MDRWARLRGFYLANLKFGPIFWLVLCGFLFTAAIAASTFAMIGSFRERALVNSQREIETTLTLLARHLDQRLVDFQGLQNRTLRELPLSDVHDRVSFVSRMSQIDIHEKLKAKVDGSGDFAGLNIFGAEGQLLNSSNGWPVKGTSISDRAYFHQHQQPNAPAVLVELVRSRLGNGWALVFSHRIVADDGSLLGLITRAIAPKEFEDFFGTLSLSEHSAVSMMHHDGTLLARFPVIEDMVGRKFPNQPRFTRQSQTSPVITLVSPIDSKQRLATSRALDTLPITVLATTTMDAALAEWQQQTRFLIMVGALSAAVVGLIFSLIIRQLAIQHKAARNVLALKTRHLDRAVNNMSQGLLLFDRSERLVISNNRYADMFGVSSQVVKPGCTLRELIQHRKDTGSFSGDVDDYCKNFVANLELGKITRNVISAPGNRLIELSYRPLPEGGWVTTLDDITERKRVEEKIAYLAHFDALTDLPNRASFKESLDLAFAQPINEQQLAVLYIDIDEFKAINDTLGHPVGDSLLKDVAARLKASAGPNDFIARLGGDEFAILHYSSHGNSDLNSLIARIYDAIRRPFNCLGHQLVTDASIGVALATADTVTSDQLVMNADLALYQAKAGGRRTVCFFEPKMEEALRRRRDLEMNLKQAISDQQFELHYQPLVDMKTRQIMACEALVRWHHPDRGFISPVEFIPLAEDTGLIEQLGQWVLDTACTEAATWPGKTKVAVNVSPVQLKDATFSLKVARALALSGLDASRLELEVTEAVFISEDTTSAVLQQIRQLGVGIALDDFGTGYSSLSYLQRFPFDKLKIDRTFVKSIDKPGGSRPIVEAVLSIASALSMMTVAEGVETEAQFNTLNDLGCDQMQGYFHSKPMPAAQLTLLFSERRKAVA